MAGLDPQEPDFSGFSAGPVAAREPAG